jgi:hypothetical protein
MKKAAENIDRMLETSRNGPMLNKDGPAVLYQAQQWQSTQCNVKDGQNDVRMIVSHQANTAAFTQTC